MEAGTFQSLIVPLDLTEASDRALPAARALAARGQLPVHLVATISPGLEPKRYEAQLAQRGALFDTTVEVHALPAHMSADGVAAFARERRSPLLCLASHARTAVGELVLGSVSGAILRAGRMPAAVLGPHAIVSPDAPPEHLLVCVDEFSVGQPLMEDAASWVATFGGDAELFEAVADPSDGPSATKPPALVATADGFGWTDATSAVVSRDPVAAIVDEAARRPGTTIAMASHLRHGLARLALGSTTSEVIRRHDGLVLVVPQLGDDNS